MSSSSANANACTAVVQAAVAAPAQIVTYLNFSSCNPADTGTVVNILTDQFGCDSAVVATVSFNPIVLVNVVVVPDSGAATGSITVTPAGGQPPYDYAWSNGDTTPTADSLAAGAYTLTITDALDCMTVFENMVTVGTSSPHFDLQTLLFPNPCNNYLILSAMDMTDAGEHRIWVTDATGRPALPPVTPSGTLTHIETAILPPGVYLTRIVRAGRLRWSGAFIKI
ncbi:MAG: hypothetical protein DYG98_16255 [Haliscomenobacteraceae bacterium CHB4]|nr:hypothetical protein [Saprospiraceae bacterium]MCE7924601.1 hypothetical protein [Haliscomenobacteraceae bacterium CHB4]